MYNSHIVELMDGDELRAYTYHLNRVNESLVQIRFSRDEVIDCLSRAFICERNFQSMETAYECRVDDLHEFERMMEKKYKDKLHFPEPIPYSSEELKEEKDVTRV